MILRVFVFRCVGNRRRMERHWVSKPTTTVAILQEVPVSVCVCVCVCVWCGVCVCVYYRINLTILRMDVIFPDKSMVCIYLYVCITHIKSFSRNYFLPAGLWLYG
jgi:hypothetical protein